MRKMRRSLTPLDGERSPTTNANVYDVYLHKRC